MKPRHIYFPVGAAQKSWGMYATCAGHGVSEPNAPFPSRAHPDEYYFTWEVGRILREWQLIYIESGGGAVEFRGRRRKVRAGSFIALAPGCWHRYRPDPRTGWTTFWLGFAGELAERFAAGAGLDTSGHVRDFPRGSRFGAFFANAVSDVIDGGIGKSLSAAAKVATVLAALADDFPPDGEVRKVPDLVMQAQAHIREHASEIVDFAALAESLHVSYRSFRYLFRRETGGSPLRYQLSIRLMRAKNLLRSSDMTVTDIARSLGFSSKCYFSRFFRAQTGCSAAAYRRRHAGHVAQ